MRRCNCSADIDFGIPTSFMFRGGRRWGGGGRGGEEGCWTWDDPHPLSMACTGCNRAFRWLGPRSDQPQSVPCLIPYLAHASCRKGTSHRIFWVRTRVIPVRFNRSTPRAFRSMPPCPMQDLLYRDGDAKRDEAGTWQMLELRKHHESVFVLTTMDPTPGSFYAW